MARIRIDQCTNLEVAQQRQGYWTGNGYQTQLLRDCDVIQAQATAADTATGNAYVMQGAAFVVLAWKP